MMAMQFDKQMQQELEQIDRRINYLKRQQDRPDEQRHQQIEELMQRRYQLQRKLRGESMAETGG